MSIETALTEATGIKPKNVPAGPKRQEYLESLVKAVSNLDDTTWELLYKPAAEWAASATTALNGGEDIPDFPDLPGNNEDTTTQPEEASEMTNVEEVEEIKPVAKKAAKKVKAKKAAPEKKSSNGKSKMSIIAGLLQRKNGCTTKDILEATGWPSVSVPAQAKAAHLKLRKQKEKGSPTRYFGA